MGEGRLDPALSRRRRAQDLDRGVLPADDLGGRLLSAKRARLGVVKDAADEGQDTGLSGCVDLERAGLPLDLEDLQERRKRNAPDEAARLRPQDRGDLRRENT